MSEEEKKEYEELKSLLYTGTISQYGKRKLIAIIKKQQEEIEKKNKIINEIAFELHINNVFDCDYKHFKDNKCKIKYPNVPNEKDCKQCIINYFTNKVEE